MSTEPQSDLSAYVDAMKRGDVDACIRIEQRHDLFGYPPELVSVGLAAIAEGREPAGAIEAHLEELERAS